MLKSSKYLGISLSFFFQLHRLLEAPCCAWRFNILIHAVFPFPGILPWVLSLALIFPKPGYVKTCYQQSPKYPQRSLVGPAQPPVWMATTGAVWQQVESTLYSDFPLTSESAPSLRNVVWVLNLFIITTCVWVYGITVVITADVDRCIYCEKCSLLKTPSIETQPWLYWLIYGLLVVNSICMYWRWMKVSLPLVETQTRWMKFHKFLFSHRFNWAFIILEFLFCALEFSDKYFCSLFISRHFGERNRSLQCIHWTVGSLVPGLHVHNRFCVLSGVYLFAVSSTPFAPSFTLIFSTVVQETSFSWIHTFIYLSVSCAMITLLISFPIPVTIQCRL